MLKKTALTVFSVLALGQFAYAGFSLDGVLDASKDVVAAATMSDEQIMSEALKARVFQDKAHTVAPASSPYTIRLAKITKVMKTDCTKQLNYKVYITKDVNAFAMADGTVRVYSALMDQMTDDEIRYVLGHEIGHVSLGHSKNKLMVAHTAAAARKVGSTHSSTTVSALTDSQIGDFAEKLIKAQFSQVEENAADQYALKVMKKNKYDPKAAVTALHKLEKLFGNEKSVFASHPAPGDRAAAMEKSL